MCGIAGILSPSSNDRLVGPMLRQMQHRGPDGSGIWTRRVSETSSLILGHVRLSILDLSNAGAQPMTDSSENYAITFNGEIYNYIEVREELKKAGAVFQSQSDTEVLL